MFTTLPYPTVELKPERLKNLQQGHPWVFSGAVAKCEAAADGDLVQIHCGKLALGVGFYNSKADIAVRVLTHTLQTIDQNFFMDRFEKLRQEKEHWLPAKTDAYRLVFGESDQLPGLVVDLYAKICVIQCHTLGMARLKHFIVSALRKIFSPLAIVERSDLPSRVSEGSQSTQSPLLFGELPEQIVVLENGRQFKVDVLHGQKTGFFLDQRENRNSLRRWVSGRMLLNCFCYSGGFSVAVADTVKSVTSLDISAPAIALAKQNFELNGYVVDESKFIVGDVFDYLKSMPSQFDAILLDPPSFAKNRGQIKNAIKAYTTLNTMALQKLPVGGLLISSSCTAHIDALTFLKILHQSSVNAKCTLKVLEGKDQPFDHPYQLAFPEGRYLKFFVLQKGEIL